MMITIEEVKDEDQKMAVVDEVLNCLLYTSDAADE